MSSWPLAICVGLAVAMLGAFVGIVERGAGHRDIEVALPDGDVDTPSVDVLSLSSGTAAVPDTAGRDGPNAAEEGGGGTATATASDTGSDRSQPLPRSVIAGPRTAERTTSEGAALEGAPTDRFAVSAPNDSRNESEGLPRSDVKPPKRAALRTGSIAAIDGASGNSTANAASDGSRRDAAVLPRSVIEPPKYGAVRIDGALSVDGTPAAAASRPAFQSTRRHVVAPGQTLWLISRSLYGSGVYYRRLHRLNRARIGNPDRIYPGQVLLVPDIETDENAPPATDGR